VPPFLQCALRDTDKAPRTRISRRRCSITVVVADVAFDLRAVALTSVPSFSKGSINCKTPPHVVGCGFAQAFEFLVDDHRAHAIVGEGFHQNRTIDRKWNDMHPVHAVLARLDGVLQVKRGIGGLRRIGQRGEKFLGVREREFLVDVALRIGRVQRDSLDLGHVDEFVGLQRNRGTGSHVFHAQIECLARRREAERREHYKRAEVHSAANARRVDLSHEAGVLEVDPVDNADRPRGDEVTDTTRIWLPAMGVLGKPCENAASIS